MKRLCLLAASLLLLWGFCPPARAAGITLNFKAASAAEASAADQRFAELVEQKTEGRIEVVLHAGDALYSADALTVEALLVGDLAFATLPAAALADFVPMLGALRLPFLFSGNLSLWETLTAESTGQNLLNAVAACSGDALEALGWRQGAVQYLYLHEDAAAPGDWAGLRLYAQDALACDMLVALGAEPVTSLPAEEAAAAAQNLDGACGTPGQGETDASVFAGPGLQIPYAFEPRVFVVSAAALASSGVRDEDREILYACAKASQAFAAELATQRAEDDAAQAAAQGGRILELPADALRDLQERMAEPLEPLGGQSVYGKWAAGLEDALYPLLLPALTE